MSLQMTAFEAAMVAAGHAMPRRNQFSDGYLYAADAARFAGWKLALAFQPKAEEQEPMTEALAALEANHQWHQDYDEHEGYPDSDLCSKNTSAIASLKRALATGVMNINAALLAGRKS